MITVTRIDESGFDAMREEWDALLERSPSSTLFRTWAWQHAWWKRFRGNRTLRLYAAREAGGRLTGLAPLCLEPPATPFAGASLGFLGIERISSEYLDLIVERGSEDASAGALLEAVHKDVGWDVLELTDLLEDSAALRTWESRLEALAYTVERTPCQLCPYLELPRTADEMERSWSHSMRGSVRRAERKLADAGFSPRVVIDPPALEDALARLYDLHGSRWSARGRTGNFRDERVRGFHRDLASTLQGRIRIYTLVGGDRIIGALYTLEWAGGVSYYQSGYEPEPPDPSLRPGDYSPGTVLIHAAIRDAIASGFREFDFLRGEEPYKSRWTASVRRTWSLTAIRPGAWGARGHHRLRRWSRWSKRGAKRLLARVRSDG